jgi:hypothetical protein
MTQRRDDHAVQDQAQEARKKAAIEAIWGQGYQDAVRGSWRAEGADAGNQGRFPTQEANAWLLDRLHRIEILVERIWERIK